MSYHHQKKKQKVVSSVPNEDVNVENQGGQNGNNNAHYNDHKETGSHEDDNLEHGNDDKGADNNDGERNISDTTGSSGCSSSSCSSGDSSSQQGPQDGAAEPPPNLPLVVLIQHVFPFCDRVTWNHLSLACQELYYGGGGNPSTKTAKANTSIPPWPEGAFSLSSAVYSVAFEPKHGSLLALGGAYGMLEVWNVWNGRLQPIAGHKVDGAVNAVTFSPVDGTLLASAGDDRTIRIWKVMVPDFIPRITTTASNAGSETKEKKSSSSCRASKRLRHGHRLIPRNSNEDDGDGNDGNNSNEDTSSAADFLKVSCSQVLKCTRRGADNAVNCIAFSNCGTRIASGSSDSRVRLWDVSTGNCLRIFVSGFGAHITSLVWTSDHVLGFAGSDGILRFKDLKTENRSWLQLHRQTVNSIAFSPEQTTAVRLDPYTNDNANNGNNQDGNSNNDDHGVFLVRRRFLAAGCRNETKIQIWKKELPGSVGRLGLNVSLSASATANASETNGGNGGNMNNSNSNNNGNGYTLVGNLEGHAHSVTALVFMNATTLLSVSEDSTIRKWNVLTQTCLSVTKSCFSRCLISVAISPDKSIIATGALTRSIWLTRNINNKEQIHK